MTLLTLPASGFCLEKDPLQANNCNQTVTDRNTGLTWVESGDDIQHTWQDAISYCDQLVFAGQDDWRLPGKIELESIVDYSSYYPAMNKVLSCESSFYWSATPHKPNPPYAWGVYCADGADHWLHKSNEYYVRCVRTENKTEIDRETGLEWQKSDNEPACSWQGALGYCENLSLGGKQDWRLPSIRELKSLVDYNRYYPAIDPEIVCQSSTYWSATTVANDSRTSAWTVFFGNGDDLWKSKTENHYVRCVRSGQIEE